MPMVLKTKLDTKKYPMLPYAEWPNWIKCGPGVNLDDMDPCFIGRWGALCRDEKQVSTIIRGYCSDADQEKIWFARGGKKINGVYVDPVDPKRVAAKCNNVGVIHGTVAKPGRSLHRFRIALDEKNEVLKAIEKDASFVNQKKLAKYGLCKPMTVGNGMGECAESWHVQPIETINADIEKRMALMPIT